MINCITDGEFILRIVAMFVFLFVFLFVYITLISSFNPRSKKYRELLVDMYVVGMIKKFAEEDKIDLIKELQEYDKIIKRRDIYTKGLDRVIENELKEKVAKVQEEKLKGGEE